MKLNVAGAYDNAIVVMLANKQQHFRAKVGIIAPSMDMAIAIAVVIAISKPFATAVL
ncbi:hypothetical protein [Shewanella waksmanii]|uniref:hypothetical protein n=1 Tax=Shewanella waksmanii TaxID=213783 RepID=UPI003736175C